jgi:hypothetical protein
MRYDTLQSISVLTFEVGSTSKLFFKRHNRIPKALPWPQLKRSMAMLGECAHVCHRKYNIILSEQLHEPCAPLVRSV